jgi:hypothetical protein
VKVKKTSSGSVSLERRFVHRICFVYLLRGGEVEEDVVYEVRVDGGGVAAGGPDELLQGRLQLLPHAPVVVVVLQDPVQALQQNKRIIIDNQ